MKETDFRIRVKSTNELSNIARIDFISKEVFALKEFDGYLEEFIYTFDEVDFIESTGLKDKNGKEIYEGDVVDYLGDIELVNRNVLRVIEYKNEEACYVARLPVGVDGEEAVYLNEHDFKVIGNIYENPELLGDSK